MAVLSLCSTGAPILKRLISHDLLVRIRQWLKEGLEQSVREPVIESTRETVVQILELLVKAPRDIDKIRDSKVGHYIKVIKSGESPSLIARDRDLIAKAEVIYSTWADAVTAKMAGRKEAEAAAKPADGGAWSTAAHGAVAAARAGAGDAGASRSNGKRAAGAEEGGEEAGRAKRSKTAGDDKGRAGAALKDRAIGTLPRALTPPLYPSPIRAWASAPPTAAVCVRARGARGARKCAANPRRPARKRAWELLPSATHARCLKVGRGALHSEEMRGTIPEGLPNFPRFVGAHGLQDLIAIKLRHPLCYAGKNGGLISKAKQRRVRKTASSRGRSSPMRAVIGTWHPLCPLPPVLTPHPPFAARPAPLPEHSSSTLINVPLPSFGSLVLPPMPPAGPLPGGMDTLSFSMDVDGATVMGTMPSPASLFASLSDDNMGEVVLWGALDEGEYEAGLAAGHAVPPSYGVEGEGSGEVGLSEEEVGALLFVRGLGLPERYGGAKGGILVNRVRGTVGGVPVSDAAAAAAAAAASVVDMAPISPGAPPALPKTDEAATAAALARRREVRASRRAGGGLRWSDDVDEGASVSKPWTHPTASAPDELDKERLVAVKYFYKSEIPAKISNPSAQPMPSKFKVTAAGAGGGGGAGGEGLDVEEVTSGAGESVTGSFAAALSRERQSEHDTQVKNLLSKGRVPGSAPSTPLPRPYTKVSPFAPAPAPAPWRRYVVWAGAGAPPPVALLPGEEERRSKERARACPQGWATPTPEFLRLEGLTRSSMRVTYPAFDLIPPNPEGPAGGGLEPPPPIPTRVYAPVPSPFLPRPAQIQPQAGAGAQAQGAAFPAGLPRRLPGQGPPAADPQAMAQVALAMNAGLMARAGQAGMAMQQPQAMGPQGMGMQQMQPQGMQGMGMQQMQPQGMQGMGVQQMQPQSMQGMGMQQMQQQGMQGMGMQQMQPQGMQGMGMQQMQPQGMQGMGVQQMQPQGMQGMGMQGMQAMGPQGMGVSMQQPQGPGLVGGGMQQQRSVVYAQQAGQQQTIQQPQLMGGMQQQQMGMGFQQQSHHQLGLGGMQMGGGGMQALGQQQPQQAMGYVQQHPQMGYQQQALGMQQQPMNSFQQQQPQYGAAAPQQVGAPGTAGCLPSVGLSRGTTKRW
jgi:hypothetical protein